MFGIGERLVKGFVTTVHNSLSNLDRRVRAQQARVSGNECLTLQSRFSDKYLRDKCSLSTVRGQTYTEHSDSRNKHFYCPAPQLSVYDRYDKRLGLLSIVSTHDFDLQKGEKRITADSLDILTCIDNVTGHVFGRPGGYRERLFGKMGLRTSTSGEQRLSAESLVGSIFAHMENPHSRYLYERVWENGRDYCYPMAVQGRPSGEEGDLQLQPLNAVQLNAFELLNSYHDSPHLARQDGISAADLIANPRIYFVLVVVGFPPVYTLSDNWNYILGPRGPDIQEISWEQKAVIKTVIPYSKIKDCKGIVRDGTIQLDEWHEKNKLLTKRKSRLILPS